MARTEAPTGAGSPPSRSLRMVYLAPVDIQVARVEREFAANFCSALARLGIDIELVALGVRLSKAEKHRPVDPLALYGLETPFPVQVVPTGLHQDSRSSFVGLSRLWVHTFAVVTRLLRPRPGQRLVVYMRNYLPALALMGLRSVRPFEIVFQCHSLPQNTLQSFVLSHCDGVVAQSETLARELVHRHDVAHVVSAHHGVDLRRYASTESKAAIRSRIGFPTDKRIAVYTGKIYAGYDEVSYLLDAAADESCKGINFVLVGGREDQVRWWRGEVIRRGLNNVEFTGFVPPGVVHDYQRAADVLLLYYPSWVPSLYLSPGKLLGYMASGVPIVSADIPVLRELLGDPPAATVVPGDSPRSLAHAIRAIFDKPEPAQALARQARGRVEAFTWDRRAERIIAFVEGLPRRNRQWG